jgi:hypothetical protein
MPIYTETIINRWFNKEKNLKILNGIIRHLSDKQIAKETSLRIDRIANYRSKLKKKGLLTAGFYSINHEKLGLVKLMDIPKGSPSEEDIFLIRLARISRPFGYLRIRLMPKNLVEEGYQLGPNLDVITDFKTPFIIEKFTKEFNYIYGTPDMDVFEISNNTNNSKIDLLSIYICKEVEKGNYGARTLAKAISEQISEDELGVQPSISNVNRRLQSMKKEGIITKACPLNFVPLRPYYNLDSSIINKNENFYKVLAAFSKLNVIARFNEVLNYPEKVYATLQYHYSLKWDILNIFKEYLGEIIFFDHTAFGLRRTLPFEYFKEQLSQKK